MRTYELIDSELSDLQIKMIINFQTSVPSSLPECGLPWTKFEELKNELQYEKLKILRTSGFVPLLADFFISENENAIKSRALSYSVALSGFITFLCLSFSWLNIFLLLPAWFVWLRGQKKAYDYAIVRAATRTELGFCILFGLKQIYVTTADYKEAWIYKGRSESIKDKFKAAT